MTWDHACPWVQIHTADLPGTPAPWRPCGRADDVPTGSFNSGVDLIRLEPGETASASWRIAGIG